MASNEKEIRNKFKHIFEKSFPNFIIRDEFNGGTMQTRTDLTCFSENYIIMVEIKSNRDSLVRLENQVNDYCKYSNNVIVILDIIHKESYIKLCKKSSILKRNSYEIMYYENRDLIYHAKKIELLNKYFIHTWRKSPYLFDLLWHDEKKQLISFIKGRSKFNIDKIVKSIYSINELNLISHKILYDRAERYNSDLFNKLNYGRIEYIELKEVKQTIFNHTFIK